MKVVVTLEDEDIIIAVGEYLLNHKNINVMNMEVISHECLEDSLGFEIIFEE